MIIRAQFLVPARGPNSRTCVLVFLGKFIFVICHVNYLHNTNSKMKKFIYLYSFKFPNWSCQPGLVYICIYPWISTIFSCVRRKSSFNLLWNDRLTFCVSHNLWPPQIKTASSTDSLSLARCTRYFCISSQALHSTAPSGSLSSKSEWLTMHDIAWCTWF